MLTTVFATIGALLLSLLTWLLPSAPAFADAGQYLSSESYGEVAAELKSLQPLPGSSSRPLSPDQQQRLADLQLLEQTIANSDDRAQISNESSHSVGIFARYKKELPSQAANFYVLAPGNSTDDDYNVVGLYVPANVNLSWGENGKAAAAQAPRVARVLDGEVLSVTDNPEQADTYSLSLPAFSVAAQVKGLASLPNLDQSKLDLERETAPVD